MDFVVLDGASGVFDNNAGSDYGLPLLGAPTEQQVLQRRAQAQEAAERERLAVRAAAPPSTRLLPSFCSALPSSETFSEFSACCFNDMQANNLDQQT